MTLTRQERGAVLIFVAMAAFLNTAWAMPSFKELHEAEGTMGLALIALCALAIIAIVAFIVFLGSQVWQATSEPLHLKPADKKD